MEKSNQQDQSCQCVDVPSDDEVKALDEMRRIKGEVRLLKKQLAEMNTAGEDGNSEKRSSLEHEMATLKAEWNTWAEKRKEAERVRMIILGHEEGSL